MKSSLVQRLGDWLGFTSNDNEPKELDVDAMGHTPGQMFEPEPTETIDCGTEEFEDDYYDEDDDEDTEHKMT